MLTFMMTNFAAACSANNLIFGLKPWYAYLKLQSTTGGGCSVVFNQTDVLGAHSPVILILLAIVDDLLRLAAIVAVGYVIYGGFRYITSQGAPDQTAAAQQTVLNAVVGLVISLIAVVLVSFIGRSLS